MRLIRTIGLKSIPTSIQIDKKKNFCEITGIECFAFSHLYDLNLNEGQDILNQNQYAESSSTYYYSKFEAN